MRITRLVGIVSAVTLLAASACEESPTEPTEMRVLGLVATPAGGLQFPGIETNPGAWIVEGRRIRIAITTEGLCDVVRPDWDVRVADGSVENPGLVFILPYEVRSTRCVGSSTADREGPPRTTFTDTLEIEFATALEATVRVVSGDGQVFDRPLDFHPGWPPEPAGPR